MHIQIKPEHENFIRGQIATGEYNQSENLVSKIASYCFDIINTKKLF